MNDSSKANLELLAGHLLRRRDAILANWSERLVQGDDLGGLAQLSRAEFYDHIPSVLNALHAELRQPDGREDEAARRAAAEHGAHRWQQGFDLLQVIRDWGELHRELLREFDRFSAGHEEIGNASAAEACDVLAMITHEGIARSVGEYQRLQRVEAGGRASEIERVLSHPTSTSRRQGGELESASEQLNGNLGTIESAVDALANEQLLPAQVAMLDRIRAAAGEMGALLLAIRDLSRLEADLEDRTFEPLDAAQLLREAVGAFKGTHGLSIEYAGPVSLAVRGDRAKIHQIIRTIVLDVLREFSSREMVLRCQANPPRRWSLIVKVDGLDSLAAAGGDLAGEVERITKEARANQSAPPLVETRSRTALVEMDADSSRAEPSPDGDDVSRDGPGVGLAIVRRLCELLDATLEINPDTERGSTFRVILPRDYKE